MQVLAVEYNIEYSIHLIVLRSHLNLLILSIKIILELFIEPFLDQPFMILSLCTRADSQSYDLSLNDVLLIFLDSACSRHLIFIFLISLKEFANKVSRIHPLHSDLQMQVENDIDKQVLVDQKNSVV